ncbi:UNVERIFIED_CONTAM: hypothetical protein Sradi_6249300 [Sesamum radiatum]|uniref:Myb/SANT-like domain-containing protein n=1 Tax=Sesamum radiatum TaxID=300843 RepID=A0AAW2KAC5_SESRA
MAKQRKLGVVNESKRDRMNWSAEMDEILLDAFVAKDEKGNMHDGTWTSTAFDNIVKVCVEKFGHANPNAAKWRYTRIQNYDKLERLFAKDRAKGKGAVSAKEKSHQWREEENTDITNSSIHEVEFPNIYVESNSPTNASS